MSLEDDLRYTYLRYTYHRKWLRWYSIDIRPVRRAELGANIIVRFRRSLKGDN